MNLPFGRVELFMIDAQSTLLSRRFRKQILSNEVKRVNSIDNGLIIHTIVPRHVETVVLLCRKAEQADRHIAVDYEPQGRHMEKRL